MTRSFRLSNGKLRPNPYRLFVWGTALATASVATLLAVFTELGSAQCLVIGLNVGAFVMCGYDKSIAGGKATRVPEAVLLGAGLLGGSAGLLLGMKVFRHKTAKASFQFVLAIVIIVQLAVLKYFGVLDELALWMRSS